MTTKMHNIGTIERNDDTRLGQLKGVGGFDKDFTVGDVKRHFKWSYNRSYRTCMRLVESGDLKRLSLGFKFEEGLRFDFE